VSLEGSTLRADDGGNKDVYGKKINAKAIVRNGEVQTPAEAKPLVDLLQRTSPKRAM
jgi:lipid-binding SYLF domain-containing protein